MHVFDLIALLIALSGAFIFINTVYLKLPASLGLMILTVLLSLATFVFGVVFPSLDLASQVKAFDFRDVLNQVVISVILFAGALNMDIRKMGDQRMPVLVISILGALISTAVIGTILYYLLNFLSIEISFMYSLVFGAVISSTDPISATNTTKRFAIPKALEIKIEGESLFNGAFSVVLAFVLYHIAIAAGDHNHTTFDIVLIVAGEIFGGIVIGLAMGYIGYLLLKFIDNEDVQVEVLVTLALVMVGSFISEYFNIYSKLVALVMGLLIGNMGRDQSGTSEEKGSVSPYVYKFWNLLEQTMAVMLFVLMGFEMLVITWHFDNFTAGFIAVNVVLFGRWISIYLPMKMLGGGKRFHKDAISVLTWSAFRGGLPIAVILALNDFEGKELLITMTYVVVVCSILFQGFTLPILMKERFSGRVV